MLTSSDSRWAAVLGSPISHSLSPVLHRAAYAALGLPWSYTAREVVPSGLPAVLSAARADRACAGFSLTMPLKTTAVPLLDALETDLRVVNTVVRSDAGLTGYNTDVAGITAALLEVSGPRGAALVLGSGGTARAAVRALQLWGCEVTVACRRPGAVAGWGVEVVEFGSARPEAFETVVATTPAGATDALAAQGWPTSTALVEVVYAPWPTRLAAAAHLAGARVAGGHTVLLGQAVEQVTLMTGMSAPVAAMRAALASQLELSPSPAENPGE